MTRVPAMEGILLTDVYCQIKILQYCYTSESADCLGEMCFTMSYQLSSS